MWNEAERQSEVRTKGSAWSSSSGGRMESAWGEADEAGNKAGKRKRRREDATQRREVERLRPEKIEDVRRACVSKRMSGMEKGRERRKSKEKLRAWWQCAGQ